MVSRADPPRARKRPEERREEILTAAAAIALEHGLERITLRAVAERLGVRPGLITHYFPAAEDLVIAAFVRAALIERERFFPADGPAIDRLAHFLGHIESGASLPLARLWLNARHLSRFSPVLGEALGEQDALDRERLCDIIRDGVAEGAFAAADPRAAAVRILIAVDGAGSYVNDTTMDHSELERFAPDVADWSLGMPPGTLRSAIERQRVGG